MGELKPGGVRVVVAAAYDYRVGVDGLGVLSSGDGVRSRTCDRWLMILEVTVSGLRKEGVWPGEGRKPGGFRNPRANQQNTEKE